ncbi:MAG: hypothetical protein LBS49_07230 [Candidatus Accumulibacter sp.]|nr:hypothetical protein [Accumulibacter sp.]
MRQKKRPDERTERQHGPQAEENDFCRTAQRRARGKQRHPGLSQFFSPAYIATRLGCGARFHCNVSFLTRFHYHAVSGSDVEKKQQNRLKCCKSAKEPQGRLLPAWRSDASTSFRWLVRAKIRPARPGGNDDRCLAAYAQDGNQFALVSFLVFLNPLFFDFGLRGGYGEFFLAGAIIQAGNVERGHRQYKETGQGRKTTRRSLGRRQETSDTIIQFQTIRFHDNAPLIDSGVTIAGVEDCFRDRFNSCP